jgi:putative endonuclease
MDHIFIGALGEEIALNFLKNKGFSLVSRNYRKKFGEIDLIVSKLGILYFVEVKAVRGSFERDSLIGKISSRKINKLTRVIHVYLSENKILSTDWRLSGVILSIDEVGKRVELEFIENLY